MTTTNPTLLAMPIAKNGTKNTIPETQAAAGNGLMSQSTGFPPETALPLGAGGKAPTREDFNGAFNLLSDIAFYAQKGWTFEYDATQDYYKGCVVIDPADGNRYECIADMPVADTIAPHSDTNNDYWKAFSLGGGVPVGFIMPYAGTGLAEGFLDCDGSAVSRTMYPDLFAAIGTTWGAGDGSTTFNLPDQKFLTGVKLSIGETAPVVTGASYSSPAGSLVDTDYLGHQLMAFRSSGQDVPGVDAIDGVIPYNGGTADYSKVGTFNAATRLPIYADLSEATGEPENQYSEKIHYMIKAFDGQTPDSALIDVTQYAQDLAHKADRSLSNLNATGEARFAHVVIDSYYDSTTGGWWREYADGWIEQGGMADRPSTTVTITLFRPYADTNYTVLTSCSTTVSDMASGLNDTASGDRTTTTFVAGAINTVQTYRKIIWTACGMGASA